MRVLVTGGGQLARELDASWIGDEVHLLPRARLDVTDEAAVWEAVHELAPEVVVHTAAWTDVDGCEGDPDRAHRTNALGAWWVARAATAVGARLVHVSTDYVFGGPPPLEGDGTPRGWTETDPPAPVSVYGRSKLAGEQLVGEAAPGRVTVRTGWLAGAHGRNFVTAVLAAAASGGPLELPDDQVGCPTTTADLSVALRHLAVAGRAGTYHVVNRGRATRAEQAARIVAAAGLDVEVRGVRTDPSARPAPRPAWSVLETRHARLTGVPPLQPWPGAFDALVGTLGDVPHGDAAGSPGASP